MAELLLLFLMGLAGGFLAGLIGIGGGVMYILILPYLLVDMGFPQEEIVQYTIANSLVGTLFAALSGNLALIKRNEFYWKEVVLIGVFGTAFSMALLYFLVNTTAYQKTEFNLVVIGLMILIAIRTIMQSKRPTGGQYEKKMSPFSLGLIGSSAGSVSALSGLGGGTVIIPLLNSGLNMSMHKAKAISLGAIFITSLSLSLFNLFETPMVDYQNQSTGYIVWPLALVISLGVIIGAPFGVHVARKLSNKLISYIFVLFVLVVIVDKFLQLI